MTIRLDLFCFINSLYSRQNLLIWLQRSFTILYLKHRLQYDIFAMKSKPDEFDVLQLDLNEFKMFEQFEFQLKLRISIDIGARSTLI